MLRENEDLNPNEVGVGKNTALHFVARTGNVKLYNLLIEKGTDQHIKNEKDEIPLVIIIESVKLKVTFFKLISRHY
jgi:hypothetical protein